jgi:phage shock protein C
VFEGDIMKKLQLSRTNKVFAGVCGGFAEYFNVDPTLVRIVFVLLTLVLNVVIITPIVYVVCWALLPLPNDME